MFVKTLNKSKGLYDASDYTACIFQPFSHYLGGNMSLKINFTMDDNMEETSNLTRIADELGEAIWYRLMSCYNDLESALPDKHKERRDIRNFLKNISSCGCQIVHILPQPVCLVVNCPDVGVADRLSSNVEQKSLDAACNAVFQDLLKAQFSLDTLQLSLTLDKKELLMCIRNIIGKGGRHN